MIDTYFVITGASSGIGFSTLVEASKRTPLKLIATCRPGSSIDIPGIDFHSVELDLSSEQSITNAAAQILKISGGKIAGLFNNAGYALQLAMEDTPSESLKNQMQVNFLGPVQLTNLLLPAIRAFPGSKVIFNSSVLGFVTMPFRGPYSASKYAVEAAADAYRMELQNTNTSIVIIQPGPINANFKANALSQLNAHASVIRKSRLSYVRVLARLIAGYAASETTSETVAKCVIDIINTDRPKPRYRITRATMICNLIRWLPTPLKDKMFLRAEKVDLNVSNSK